MQSTSRAQRLLASIAVVAMTVSPALARDRWPDRHWHRRDRGGIDAGDVIVGAVILGGLAAVLSSASSKRAAREDERSRADTGSDWDDRSAGDDAPQSSSGGFDDAVDRCVAEVERGDRRVGDVEGVDRQQRGYRVTGRLEDGRPFRCAVGDDGRIDVVAVDGYAI